MKNDVLLEAILKPIGNIFSFVVTLAPVVGVVVIVIYIFSIIRRKKQESLSKAHIAMLQNTGQTEQLAIFQATQASQQKQNKLKIMKILSIISATIGILDIALAILLISLITPDSPISASLIVYLFLFPLFIGCSAVFIFSIYTLARERNT